MRIVAVPRCKHMPAVFLEWQLRERQDMFEMLLKGEHPRFWAAHLPVLSTCNEDDAAFPIQSVTKGVGLLPKEKYLAESVAQINKCLECCWDRPPAETRQKRIEAARLLYDRAERIDDTAFGSIEIFRGQTYRNLVRDARATLLFTSPGPHYLSYQFNCIAQIVDPDDLSFQFIRGMRFLFEMERFHIQQPEYPLGYVLHIKEVLDKTPRRVGDRPGAPEAG